MAGNSKQKPTGIIKDIGRPSKFTPERRAAIVDAIAARIPYELAAEANGICEDTLYDWLKTAKKHREQGMETDYTRFSEDIKRAELSRVREHTENISERVERWQADAWMLERRWHKHYGPNAQLKELNERLARLEHDDRKEDTNQGENSEC